MRVFKSMKAKFGFLLFPDFEDLDFFGPWEMIAHWSKLYQGPETLILIDASGKKVTSYKGLTLQTDVDFQRCPPLDFLLVPGGQGTRTAVDDQVVIEFIKRQAVNCQNLLSVCTGAFLFQRAGILTGKKATTHWASLERLKAFSEVTVVEQRFIQDGNVWTSAGVSAGIDMTLAFIAETSGEKTAGDIQLFSEYYPSEKIYDAKNIKLPTYVVKK